jgi:nucleoside-diphosphate-sugar epimerase
MRILIIGGTRFIGPHVVRRLCASGHEIALFHRGQTQADLAAGVRHILGDRRHLVDFRGEFEHFAPQVVLDMIPADEHDARDVVRTFKGIAGRVVAISSQDVYRAYGVLIGIEPGPIEPVPLAEDAPLRQKRYPYRDRAKGPQDRSYEYEKIWVESVIMGDPGLPGTILRLPMVYGPRDPQHRTFEYLKRMDDGRPAIVLGEGMARWRWTKGYVENVAAAIALAVSNDRAAGRVYNVGEGATLAEVEWVRAIGEAAGWKGQVVVVPDDRLPGHLATGIRTDQHLVTDATRIREELGYAEPVSREGALRRTVAWERAHPPEQPDPQAFDYAAEDALLAELEWRGGDG